MQFLNLQPIQSVRFETKSTHKAEAFVFSVPALKNLVDLAEASSSAKISNKIDLQRQNLTFVQRNDVSFQLLYYFKVLLSPNTHRKIDEN